MANIILALDGEAIIMKNLRITLGMQYQDKDQSGQTSSTTHAEQGIKAKELQVSGLIPFRDDKTLTRLATMASTTTSGGAMKTWRVANLTANVVGIRQVVFAGKLEAAEQDGKMAWSVQFTLREKHSVPEKRQARNDARNGSAAAKQGGSSSDGGAVADAKESDQQLTWFEKTVLKPVNDSLGKVVD
ncbi:baseplate complex protein [Citrobacter freundii]|uniref:baseplate complex protein n=1 Tax=Citrobacter freundii TaxID=546 RepID=UPI001FFDF89D|nr:hypothetical protein [Citrobacter freundii]